MAYKGRHASLSVEQAQQLLSCVIPAEVIETRQVAFTNDVFRTATRLHGTWYVKFHTARWYLDLEDTAPVVDRELSGYELLRRRGIALPYLMWGDCSRVVTPQSVVISEELPGTSVPVLFQQDPGVAPALAEALGNYLGTVHAIAFTNRAPLSRLHVLVAKPEGRIPYVNPGKNMPWDWEKQDPAVEAQRGAMSELAEARQRNLLDAPTHEALAALFGDMADVLRAGLGSPRFALVNCHANHFHAQQTGGEWQITGMYDFEAVSADDPTGDLVEVEVGLTTALRSFDWRDGFVRGYGHLPDFCRYKLKLLQSLVYYLCEGARAGRFGDIVPDPRWLSRHLKELAEATEWEQLSWYPPTPP